MYKQTQQKEACMNKNIYKVYVGQQYVKEVGGKENSTTNTV